MREETGLRWKAEWDGDSRKKTGRGIQEVNDCISGWRWGKEVGRETLRRILSRRGRSG